MLQPLDLPAGLGCSFDVRDEPLAGSKGTSTTFSNGTTRFNLKGRDRVTNLEGGGSVVLNTSGTLSLREDGDTVDIESTGHALFYFFPGDQGPFGEVGGDGGFYYFIGHVREVLDNGAGGLITSFAWNGRVTDVCALIG